MFFAYVSFFTFVAAGESKGDFFLILSALEAEIINRVLLATFQICYLFVMRDLDNHMKHSLYYLS